MNFKCYVDGKQYLTNRLNLVDNKFSFEAANNIVNVDKENICKETELRDVNGCIVYENDMISIADKTMIVKYYKGPITIDHFEIYIDGLVFMDFDFKPYLIGADILKNPSLIQVVGNTISNHIIPVGDK